jgi:hypothetical protein
VKQEKVTMSIWHVLPSTVSKRRSRRKLRVVNCFWLDQWMILLVAGKPMKGQGEGLALTYLFGCRVCPINGYCLAFASFTSPVTISKTIFSDSHLQS